MINISRFSNHQYTPVFKGYSGFTDIEVDGKKYTVNNYTGFMRDFPTLKFTKEYILKTFPNGTNIAEFGCSIGHKTYSLLMLLDKANQNKKFKITGYDFPEVIKKANTKEYTPEVYSRYEQVLFPDYKEQNIYDYTDVKKEEAEEIQKAFKKYFQIKTSFSNTYQPIESQCKGLIKFESGDIRNVNKILKLGNTGVIIFQNALYHILSDSLSYDTKKSINMGEISKLFMDISKTLPQNGIFVLGNLPADHIYDIDDEKDSHLHYQNGERIKVFDTSLVHEELKKAGFIPVFYEKSPDKSTYERNEAIYLPSVWKKL